MGTASRLSGVTFAVLAQEVGTYSTLSDLKSSVVIFTVGVSSRWLILPSLQSI